VTNPSDLAQTLIADIDRLLRKTKGISPIGLCTRFALQRRLLERVRNYLVMQQTSALPSAALDAVAPPDHPVAVKHPARSEPSPAKRLPPPPPPPLRSQPPQEIEKLRESLFQTLQREIDGLIARRDGLLQEIQQLETQKSQQIALPQALQPWDVTEVERLQALRDRADQLLTSMDSSLHLAFHSLDKNLKSYHDSLSHSIDRMHSLGNQGEVLFSTMINQLAEEWGRSASSYLNSSPERSSKKTYPTEIFPFPGVEIQTGAAHPTAIAASSNASAAGDRAADIHATPSLANAQADAHRPGQATPIAEPVNPQAIDQVHTLADLFAGLDSADGSDESNVSQVLDHSDPATSRPAASDRERQDPQTTVSEATIDSLSLANLGQEWFGDLDPSDIEQNSSGEGTSGNLDSSNPDVTLADIDDLFSDLPTIASPSSPSTSPSHR
jgi:hypothetical protein